MLKELEIEGFDYALYTDSAYNTTCEDIRISGQGEAGIYNQRQVIHFRRLRITNSVPVLSANFQDAHSTFVDCELLGGTPGTTALQTTGGLLARNITSTGYAHVIAASGPTVSEYASQASLRLHSTATHTRNLPSRETPDWFWSLNPGDVANVADYGANPNDFVSDSTAIQAAFNSGKPVILFPPNTGSTRELLRSDAPARFTSGSHIVRFLGHNAEQTPLAPPGDFTANPVGGQVQLTWLDMANAETGYEVQRRPGNSATWSTLGTTAANASGFTDTTPAGNGAAFNIARSGEPGGTTYGWIDIGPSSGSPGTQLTFTAVGGFPASDEGRATFNLPAGFSFPHFGTTYAAGSQLYVGTNGFITPTIFTGNTYQISDLAGSGTGVSNMIAPFWRDLDAKAGS